MATTYKRAGISGGGISTKPVSGGAEAASAPTLAASYPVHPIEQGMITIQGAGMSGVLVE